MAQHEIFYFYFLTTISFVTTAFLGLVLLTPCEGTLLFPFGNSGCGMQDLAGRAVLLSPRLLRLSGQQLT